MRCKRYSHEDKAQWDTFVGSSKNGTFLFFRDYMDYHSDRFVDHSLLFYDDKSRLVALLPGNEVADKYCSHQGLTYGGFILSPKNHMVQVLELFRVVREYLADNGFKQMTYKQVPTCYHMCPAQEDEYALWYNGAQLESCMISSTIPLADIKMTAPVRYNRRRLATRAAEAGYYVEESDCFDVFWQINETNLLSRHGVKPVHSLDEMTLLKQRFPKHIRLFLVMKDGKPEGGAVIYVTNKKCIHVQYSASTPECKKNNALDLLYTTLINKFRNEGYQYLDFGSSNEQDGHYLNEGLISQKEGYGGRGTVYKKYVWEITDKK